MTRNLKVAIVGRMEVEGEERSGVFLAGDIDALRGAAALLGEQVDLSPAGTLDRLETPDLFWDDDGEVCWESASDVWECEAVQPSDVVRVRCGRGLSSRWVAVAVLSVDAAGTPDDTERRVFATEAEARACYPDTLAAARKAAGVQA